MKLFLLLIAIATHAVAADPYPSKPIRMVIPFAPGGATDIIGRLVANKMGETLNQPVVVENVAGAATMVGAERVARSPNDGYTVLVATSATLATNPHLYRKITYKLEDFAPVTMLAKLPMVMVMNADSPVQNVKDFVAYAKAQPGKLNYGTAGLGGTAHMVGKLVESALGVTMTDVHYKGAAPAMTDLLGGQIQVYFDAIATSLPLWRAGKIRILGVTGAERAPGAEAIPTFVESGYPGVVFYNTYSLVAPAGTPKPVIEQLNAAAVRALKSSDVRNRLLADATLPDPTTPEGAVAALKAEYDAMGKLVHSANIHLD
jgi:tripartite-type tricarboxylate transporter receptor subunit TctC